MAIQNVLIDPAAVALSPEDVVAKVNAAATQITRAGSVAAAARPIGTGEISDTKIASGAIKTKLVAEADGDKLTSTALAAAASIANTQVATGLAKANLDAMTDITRGYIRTNPTSGQFKVISIERDATGKIKTDYDDVAS